MVSHDIAQTGEEAQDELEILESAVLEVALQGGRHVVDDCAAGIGVFGVRYADNGSHEGDLEWLFDDPRRCQWEGGREGGGGWIAYRSCRQDR